MRSTLTPAQIAQIRELGCLHISDSTAQALRYMEDRRAGTLKSIRTPWSNLNDALTDGIEWHTFATLCSRPGCGKTLASQKIGHEAHDINTDQDFVTLDLQYEMLSRVIALRGISNKTGKSLRQLASAGGYRVTDEDIDAAAAYSRENQHKNIYFYEKAHTVPETLTKIRAFLRVINKPCIITYDHSVLTHKLPRQDAMDMLAMLSVGLGDIRKEFPVIILLLSQLNRECEKEERLKEGTPGNLIKESDIFGADALLQNSDLVISMHRPGKYGLRVFSQDRYQITPDDLIWQILKFRGGSMELQFYKAEFHKMDIIQAAPPPIAPTFGSAYKP